MSRQKMLTKFLCSFLIAIFCIVEFGYGMTLSQHTLSAPNQESAGSIQKKVLEAQQEIFNFKTPPPSFDPDAWFNQELVPFLEGNGKGAKGIQEWLDQLSGIMKKLDPQFNLGFDAKEEENEGKILDKALKKIQETFLEYGYIIRIVLPESIHFLGEIDEKNSFYRRSPEGHLVPIFVIKSVDKHIPHFNIYESGDYIAISSEVIRKARNRARKYYKPMWKKYKDGQVTFPSFEKNPHRFSSWLQLHIFGKEGSVKGIEKLQNILLAEELSHYDFRKVATKTISRLAGKGISGTFALPSLLQDKSRLWEELEKAETESLQTTLSVEQFRLLMEVEGKLNALIHSPMPTYNFYTYLDLYGNSEERERLKKDPDFLAMEFILKSLSMPLLGYETEDPKEWYIFLEEYGRDLDKMDALLRAAAREVYRSNFKPQEENREKPPSVAVFQDRRNDYLKLKHIEFLRLAKLNPNFTEMIEQAEEAAGIGENTKLELESITEESFRELEIWQKGVFQLVLNIVLYKEYLNRAGREPDFITGRSLGLLTSLVISGSVSLPEILEFYKRIMAEGKRLAEEHGYKQTTLTSEKDLSLILSKRFPSVYPIAKFRRKNTTVAIIGKEEQVREARDSLLSEGLIAKSKDITPAVYLIHTRFLEEEGGDLYRELIGALNLNKPEFPIVSPITGEKIETVEQIRENIMLDFTTSMDHVALDAFLEFMGASRVIGFEGQFSVLKTEDDASLNHIYSVLEVSEENHSMHVNIERASSNSDFDLTEEETRENLEKLKIAAKKIQKRINTLGVPQVIAELDKWLEGEEKDPRELESLITRLKEKSIKNIPRFLNSHTEEENPLLRKNMRLYYDLHDKWGKAFTPLLTAETRISFGDPLEDIAEDITGFLKKYRIYYQLLIDIQRPETFDLSIADRMDESKGEPEDTYHFLRFANEILGLRGQKLVVQMPKPNSSPLDERHLGFRLRFLTWWHDDKPDKEFKFHMPHVTSLVTNEDETVVLLEEGPNGILQLPVIQPQTGEDQQEAGVNSIRDILSPGASNPEFEELRVDGTYDSFYLLQTKVNPNQLREIQNKKMYALSEIRERQLLSRVHPEHQPIVEALLAKTLDGNPQAFERLQEVIPIDERENVTLEDHREMKRRFQETFEPRTTPPAVAAKAIVAYYNEDDQFQGFLVVQRNDSRRVKHARRKLDLPGGFTDLGENTANAALRELGEELGEELQANAKIVKRLKTLGNFGSSPELRKRVWVTPYIIKASGTIELDKNENLQYFIVSTPEEIQELVDEIGFIQPDYPGLLLQAFAERQQKINETLYLKAA